MAENIRGPAHRAVTNNKNILTFNPLIALQIDGKNVRQFQCLRSFSLYFM